MYNTIIILCKYYITLLALALDTAKFIMSVSCTGCCEKNYQAKDIHACQPAIFNYYLTLDITSPFNHKECLLLCNVYSYKNITVLNYVENAQYSGLNIPIRLKTYHLPQMYHINHHGLINIEQYKIGLYYQNMYK